eukprot:3733125-Amphidinium_carterae.1
MFPGHGAALIAATFSSDVRLTLRGERYRCVHVVCCCSATSCAGAPVWRLLLLELSHSVRHAGRETEKKRRRSSKKICAHYMVTTKASKLVVAGRQRNTGAMVFGLQEEHCGTLGASVGHRADPPV